MKRKFVKKENVVDTALALALGGGANVAMDYVRSSVDALATLDDKIYNAGKLVVGAVASSMIGNKMAKDAFNGIAVVGASNLIAGLMDDTKTEDQGNGNGSDGGSQGVPNGTVAQLLHAASPRRSYASKIRNGANGVPASTFVD